MFEWGLPGATNSGGAQVCPDSAVPSQGSFFELKSKQL